MHTLLVTIHQGVVPVRAAHGFSWHGPLQRIVAQLDPAIDVVISGHTHNYTNALWPDRTGKQVLVVQDYSYGMAFGELTLKLDPAQRHGARQVRPRAAGLGRCRAKGCIPTRRWRRWCARHRLRSGRGSRVSWAIRQCR